MKYRGRFLRCLSFVLVLAFLAESSLLQAAEMKDYCIIPPYVKRDVSPNILIVMDNSYIMGGEAYTGSYDPSKTYSGYFQSTLWYRYDNNQFVPDVNGIFKGNLLNWATMSRYDLLQSILVGGKSRSRQTNINTLESISNAWSKTYSGCIFNVNSGNLQITDNETANSCVLLNPARLSASTETFSVAALEPEEQKGPLSGSTLFSSLMDFLIPAAEAAKPLRIVTNNLPDAPQNLPYAATLTGEGGATPYTWSISAGSLPTGLVLIGATGTITGIPTAAMGTYSFTVKLTDINGATITKNLSIRVVAGGRVANFNVWVCNGDYTNNCQVGTAPQKQGIVDLFWDKARYGLEDFSQSASLISPDISAGTCIPASPKENFLTGIENATPVGDATTFTPLVNGMYTAVDYYKSNVDPNCNPFNNSPKCLKNFILLISAGEGADNPPNPNAGVPNILSDDTHCSATTDPPASFNLSKNSCYGYKGGPLNDLRPDEINYKGKQYVSTYIVNTMGVNGNILKEAAVAGGGNYYDVTDPTQLRAQLMQAFEDIIKRAAAGTAASVLASGEGSGANLIQAVFYPRRKFFNSATGSFDEVAWIGRLTNLWYYVDPFFVSSSIIEDTNTDKVLSLSADNVVKLRFDTPTETTVADRYTPGGGTKIDTVAFEYVKGLWEAGITLWSRDISVSPRTMYTSLNGTSLIPFSTANNLTLKPYLQAGSDGEAEAIIRYIHGEDTQTGGNFAVNPVAGFTPNYRPRTTAVDLNGDNDTLDSGESSKVWKLGDVLNSTPKISSWIPLHTYDQTYGDSTYKSFLVSASYQNREMVFAGANDGMLHAFKLGKLELSWGGKSNNEKARLTGTELGKEAWTFIPKNALPYLKYQTDPSYCHVFTADLTPYVFDASINGASDGDKTVSSWRTILIGGMRFGGGCRNYDASCTDCIKTPADGLGYSSYFAIDITNQDNPSLLWEFSSENLGFTTTGPAVVRTGDRTKNGKWFVVFGSGPTGPVDKDTQQFMGRSDQPLKIFVLDLKTGGLLRAIDPGVPNGFAGSMLNSTHDSDLDYQDDAIYIPYVKKASDGTWTQGGVGRIFTKESSNPSDWTWSTVMDDRGPVTSAVVKLQNNKKGQLWLFFGTGRYYFEKFTEVDDGTNQRHLFGVKEPCFSKDGLDPACMSQVSGGLTDVTSNPDASPDSIGPGWEIALEDDTSTYRSERVITDPIATLSGLVFFTTYKPSNDVCALGGKTYVWAVKYNTGGAGGALLKGKALLQVSTGSIEQMDLASSFKEMGGRRTEDVCKGSECVPPTAQGLSLITQPPPVKRVMHIKER